MNDAEGWSAWSAPAKLNLFLRLVGRREDGYHLLQSVFQLLDWGDQIDLRPSQDGAIRRLLGAVDVAEDDDLAVRAARLLQRETGCRRGVELRVHKQIPMGGGFGGGSSDAATVLLALNALWDCGLSTAELAALGLCLGADVPFFVHGRSAWVEGVGEQVQPIELPEVWYLVIDSGEHLATGELFQAAELTRNAAPLKMADFVPSRVGENAFEPVVRRRSAPIARLLDAIAELGRGGLTGTGGGCYLQLASKAAADEAAVALQAYGHCVVARGLHVSPVLEQLQRRDARRKVAV